MAKKLKPLTDKQQFALRAIEKGAVQIRFQQFGWLRRPVRKYYAWDSDITTQIHSLLRVHRLIRFTQPGSNILELRPVKETTA